MNLQEFNLLMSFYEDWYYPEQEFVFDIWFDWDKYYDL